MAISYKDTLYKGVTHHGMQEGFIYDNIGMINVDTVDSSGIDIYVLPKQECDIFYDLLGGTNLGSGTTFPTTKVYSDRFYRSDTSKWHWWDGYDWVIYGEAYYLMLDYFPTKAGYEKTGARVFRTDENKEYRYSGSTWVEITVTSGDTKKRIQSKVDMSIITSTDETGSFYYRINETDILLSEFWSVIPLYKFLGTGDSSAGLQVYYTKGMSPQRFQIDVSGLPSNWIIDSVDFTLESQETVPPISDITDATMTDGGSDIWYYDVASFIGGLYYRKFTVNYHYTVPLEDDVYDTYTDDITGIIGRLTADEYDKGVHTAAYTSIRYVSKTGSDSNGGTSESDAWLTLEYAASQVSTGMLVNVLAGTYAETDDIIFAVSGTSTSPIHFRAVGTVVVTTRTFRLISRSYIVIEGFTITAYDSGTGGTISLNGCNNILIYNCKLSTSYTYGKGIVPWYSSNVFVIGNIFTDYDGTYQYTMSNKDSSLIVMFNTFDNCNGWQRDDTEIYYTYDVVNDIGNYHTTSIEPDDACIGTSSYTNDGITDPYPIVTFGVSCDKAIAISWLDIQMKYGISGIVSYAFSPFLRHIKSTNVPASGNTRPHSFTKVIDGNSKERLVAYGSKTDGTDYGACEIGAYGEITDGMDNVSIQTINGTYYSISPISRILDRNDNGDIIIEGRSILTEE